MRPLSKLVCSVVVLLAAACGGDTPTETSASGARLPVSTPVAEGISDSALNVVITNAAAQKSDALVILRNGKLVYENYFGGADSPILAMSASKSFVGLAFGFLLAERKLASLDERVMLRIPTFWRVDARKADITYRHLLSHSSGLDPARAVGAASDIEARAIASRTLFAPGTGWQYNNQGVDFLAALAGRLAGKPMDEYLNEKLFFPMGITTVQWLRDSRGVPLGAGEMSIRPYDLAKIGQAILDGGLWQGKQIIPPEWIAASVAPSTTFAPDYGLLWWRVGDYTGIGITADLLTQWRSMGAPDSTIAKLEPLASASFRTTVALYAAIAALMPAGEYSALTQWLATGNHIPNYRVLGMGPQRGFSAAGWLGQYLAVFPDKKIVAVRMRRAVASDYTSSTEVNGYPTFLTHAYRLVP